MNSDLGATPGVGQGPNNRPQSSRCDGSLIPYAGGEEEGAQLEAGLVPLSHNSIYFHIKPTSHVRGWQEAWCVYNIQASQITTDLVRL